VIARLELEGGKKLMEATGTGAFRDTIQVWQLAFAIKILCLNPNLACIGVIALLEREGEQNQLKQLRLSL